MFKKSLLLATTLLVSQSFALNIVITNDDSYITHNVQQLKVSLEKAGHDVILSVPCAKQSGKGGSMGSYLTAMPVSTLDADDSGILTINTNGSGTAGYCVGNTEAEKEVLTFKEYIDGTPVTAVLHGLYRANEKWGKNPDLVISGPNEGNNLGFATNLSGTLGATHTALIEGVPAMAVSDDAHTSTPERAQEVAKIVLEIVAKLESSKVNGALMPKLTALNVNTPAELEGAKYKFTRVGWASGMNLEFGDLGAEGGYGSLLGIPAGTGMVGLNFILGEDPSGDTHPNSEANAKEAGFITISTIDASEQASRKKTKQTACRLHSLNH